MRTTVDIPDPIYRELESRAADEGKAIEELIVRCVAVSMTAEAPALPRAREGLPPVVKSKNPGSLRLGDEGVYAYIPFP
jgi:hypothetical protein